MAVSHDKIPHVSSFIMTSASASANMKHITMATLKYYKSEMCDPPVIVEFYVIERFHNVCIMSIMFNRVIVPKQVSMAGDAGVVRLVSLIIDFTAAFSS